MKDKNMKELAKELLKDKDIKDVTEFQSVLKEILKSGVETLLKL